MIDSKTAALWGASRISRPEFLGAQYRLTEIYRENLSRMLEPKLWKRKDAIERIKTQPFWR